MTLHAPDPVGKAAHRAAMLVARQDLRLLTAASPTIPREERIEALVHFARAHRAFSRAVAELEAVAPNAFAAGYELDAQSTDYIEGRAA